MNLLQFTYPSASMCAAQIISSTSWLFSFLCPVRSLRGPPASGCMTVLAVLNNIQSTQMWVPADSSSPSLFQAIRPRSLGNPTGPLPSRDQFTPPLSGAQPWWGSGPVTTGQCRAPALGWCCCYPGGTERRPKTQPFAPCPIAWP